MSSHAPADLTSRQLAALALGAIGVVYGDIGTSPLYTLNAVFFNPVHALAIDPGHVLGLLSLILWALILVVSIKYALLILRADNQGEGGTMVLLALALRSLTHSRYRRAVTLIGLFGVALFFGDAVITPAMSVLAATEGLAVIDRRLAPAVIPSALIILGAIFYIQQGGTSRVSRYFGPAMALWFLLLAALGLWHIARNPTVLEALNPWYAVQFLWESPRLSLIILGSAVLAVTGAGALYTDMGHFGRNPIRLAWFGWVFPALVLNYFGQGALLLNHCNGLDQTTCRIHPFYNLVPPALLIPLVLAATVATIIACQAVISGAFSIGRQAIQLGYLPRMKVVHTSHQNEGQIYLPAINWTLFAGVVLLVLELRSTERLAAAYGLAVTGAMLVDTLLFAIVLLTHWRWSRWIVLPLCLGFAAIDLALLSATTLKIPRGGWLPLLVALLILVLLTTWKRGRSLMRGEQQRSTLPLAPMIEPLCHDAARVEGTAVFMTASPADIPAAMLHNLKHNKVLHQHNLILHVSFLDVPLVPRSERLRLRDLGHGFHELIVQYGFMNRPDIPKALHLAAEAHGLPYDPMQTSFFVSREVLVPSPNKKMALWRQRLYTLMARNAQPATAYFNIPSNRVLELGAQVRL